jgi:hypothetical protein
MPVIINEFEIITERPPTPQPQEQTPPAQEQEPPTLRPEDIERIQRHYRQRMARIRAD